MNRREFFRVVVPLVAPSVIVALYIAIEEKLAERSRKSQECKLLDVSPFYQIQPATRIRIRAGEKTIEDAQIRSTPEEINASGCDDNNLIAVTNITIQNSLFTQGRHPSAHGSAEWLAYPTLKGWRFVRYKPKNPQEVQEDLDNLYECSVLDATPLSLRAEVLNGPLKRELLETVPQNTP